MNITNEYLEINWASLYAQKRKKEKETFLSREMRSN